MVAPVDIQINMREVDQLARAIPSMPPRIAQAMVGQINRTGRMCFTQVRRTVSAETGIPQRDLNQRSRGLAEKKARSGSLTYEIIARGKYTPLSYFDPVMRQKGVSARPWGKRRVFKDTFLARMPSGHLGVFFTRKKRTTGRRLGRELWGPSLPVELGRGKSGQVALETWNRHAAPNLTREINRVLATLKAR